MGLRNTPGTTGQQRTGGTHLTESARPEREIDLRGLYCPEPIFRIAEEMGRMQKGEILAVVADDPAAEEDIKRWAKRMGEEILDFRREGFNLRFLIRKA
jgi:TusA-related sulfurtransferase